MAKRNEIAKSILYVIAATGVVAAAVALPGIAAAFAPFMKEKRYSDKQVNRSLNKPKANELISIKEENGKTVVRLTKNGNEKLLSYKLEDMVMNKPKKWDRKWRLVIFDIPEDFKVNRTSFVYKLKELGFLPLQKSVWVWPYECEDEIDFLKEIYEIRPYVRVVRADYLDIESDLRKRFSLSQST
jgi:DNA-binding transcriptional regulator PaaX